MTREAFQHRLVAAFALTLLSTVAVASASAESPTTAEPGAELDLATELRRGRTALSADEAARRALQSAPSLAAARAAERRAREAAAQAHLAVYPRMVLTGRYTHVGQGSNSKIPFDIKLNEPVIGLPDTIDADAEFAVATDQYGVRAEVTYAVSDLFATILPAYEAAMGFADAQARRIESERHSVALTAREAFYRYVSARAALLVAESAEAQAAAHRSDVSAMVDHGALPRVEFMTADARWASSRVGTARARGATAVARRALETILHQELPGPIAIDDDLTREVSAPAADRETLVAGALKRRPEVHALRERLRAEEHSARAAAGGKLPHLSVSASYDYAKPPPELFALEESAGGSWSVGAFMTWSPNEYLEKNSEVRQSRYEMSRIRADVARLEDAVRIEVTEAYEDLLGSRAAMQAARSAILAAEESYRVRRARFRAAAAVASEVIDAQSELQRARLELIAAAVDARIAGARLARATAAPTEGAAE